MKLKETALLQPHRQSFINVALYCWNRRIFVNSRYRNLLLTMRIVVLGALVWILSYKIMETSWEILLQAAHRNYPISQYHRQRSTSAYIIYTNTVSPQSSNDFPIALNLTTSLREITTAIRMLRAVFDWKSASGRCRRAESLGAYTKKGISH